MARPIGPRKIYRYSEEFRGTAVRLSLRALRLVIQTGHPQRGLIVHSHRDIEHGARYRGHLVAFGRRRSSPHGLYLRLPKHRTCIFRQT